MSIGDTLAQARRQAGLTLTQVSQQTRVRESIIRSIEAGDFSSCGGDFYARGHIRSVADAVGADPVPLIAEYDEEHGPPGSMDAAEIFESATPIRIREPRRTHLGKVLIVALLAVIGFGAYHLVSTRGAPATAAAAATKVHTVVPPQPKPSKKPAAVEPAPKDLAVIRLTAVADCWVALNSAAGKSLYAGIVPAGQSRKWDEEHPVSLVIGNPSGVKLTVNGKAEQMHTAQVVTLSINPLSRSPVTIGQDKRR